MTGISQRWTGLCHDASGVVNTLTGTAANAADITQMAAVLHGRESDVFADAGYSGADKRAELAFHL